MTYLFYGLFLAACIILVITVMLQPGKTDAGSLFTSNISSTAFGPRGTQSALAKITIGAAVSFMLMAFLLSQQSITGTRSVLQTTSAQDVPVTDTETPNANVTDANTSTTNSATTPANVENAPNANATATPAK